MATKIRKTRKASELFGKYYYVPWPYSQKVEDRDKNHEYCTLDDEGDGVFADIEWLDSLNMRFRV